ncbi:MAG TPA: hypothetical protein VN285_05255 [Candidatus Deferrimicrobium sp.]|nr:hypothetical protein [Candidatus Deferrimicrobium sp.]
MRNKRCRSIGLTVVAAAAMILWLTTCDDDGPTKPVPVKDYPVYFSAPLASPPILFAFHPVAQRIDSAGIPWKPLFGVTVSADGKRLYIPQPTSVVVVDTDSLALIAELPYRPKWPVAVSPDNNLVAITGDDLYILRTSDYSLVYSDTDITENGHFSANSKAFYCAACWSPECAGMAYRLDMSDTPFVASRQAFSDGGVVHVIPSSDEAKWFLYLTSLVSWGSVFEVYDVKADSIIFQDLLYPGFGDMVLAPNEQHVFYTNPGNGLMIPGGIGFELTVFDVVANEIDTVIADTAFFSDSNWVAPPNLLAVTPDSRWLTILGGSLGLYVLYLFDIPNQRLVFREDWGGVPNFHFLVGLSVQYAK